MMKKLILMFLLVISTIESETLVLQEDVNIEHAFKMLKKLPQFKSYHVELNNWKEVNRFDVYISFILDISYENKDGDFNKIILAEYSKVKDEFYLIFHDVVERKYPLERFPTAVELFKIWIIKYRPSAKLVQHVKYCTDNQEECVILFETYQNSLYKNYVIDIKKEKGIWEMGMLFPSDKKAKKYIMLYPSIRVE